MLRSELGVVVHNDRPAHRNATSNVYYGTVDGADVVIKAVRSGMASKLKHELQKTTQASDLGVAPKLFGSVQCDGLKMLVLQRFTVSLYDQTPLYALLKTHQHSHDTHQMATLWAIGLAVLNKVLRLHEQHIVHVDLTAANVLLRLKDDVVEDAVLSDFGMAHSSRDLRRKPATVAMFFDHHAQESPTLFTHQAITLAAVRREPALLDLALPLHILYSCTPDSTFHAVPLDDQTHLYQAVQEHLRDFVATHSHRFRVA